MDPICINPGDKGLDAVGHQEHWRNDMANNIHNNNMLWLWASQTAHDWMDWRQRGLIDLVLHHLFAMGLFNWERMSILTRQHQPCVMLP